MAATDGDSRQLLASSLGLPNVGDVRAEVHTADVSTDSNGDGTATVSWDTEFGDGEVYVILTAQSDEGASFALSVTSSGSSQCTITVSGASTVNGTVTVNVLAIGRDAQRV